MGGASTERTPMKATAWVGGWVGGGGVPGESYPAHQRR